MYYLPENTTSVADNLYFLFEGPSNLEECLPFEIYCYDKMFTVPVIDLSEFLIEILLKKRKHMYNRGIIIFLNSVWLSAD